MTKHDTIYDEVIDQLRIKYSRADNATAIPRDDLRASYYRAIVEACAQTVEHIQVWDGNLGDHIRRRMETL
jgi:hypothetical protein